ncbi:SDR family oxidoreductase [Anoxybacillus sp. LAT_35]|uniref:SDR family oxidoreductase n=1 Tax=unclassified Anoxybacillus TaxID=2639704 RepID=UPI001EDAD0CF|nr:MULTISPECIES: SDR family oxidoreductase [unclassified Anoxybacillus]MCG5025327.1 SDR family oxidoreductase [Anoxybacillus flavithermus]MCG3083686.1 SDR family oxidoreductase [Anoxybacillus sp. LAT27]MCG6171364.1 SDR family oxidoreductase [Anoxybacillus sp. LAT_11]MCG6175272.1 SDR family oxidoreductase [Anoxybacillus sp. LAT_31]MCG6178898.1 SDR family oxidoreductase [Anoxybacillus sp. LAT_35]
MKTAIVAASSKGLGKAIATKLVSQGVNVMLASRDERKLHDVTEQLNALGKGKAAYTVTDVTDNAMIERLVEKTVETFGDVHLLVNNAGGPPTGTFATLTDDDWQQAFELNLLSYVRMIRTALPHLKKTKGKIVNIASSSIKEPIPGLLLSNTFRLGIVGLTKTLAQELAPYGILINTVAPGRIATERVAYLDEQNAKKLGIRKEELEARMKATIPLGRYGTPEEFANIVAFLLSDDNTYMTGQSLLVDGGMVKAI